MKRALSPLIRRAALACCLAVLAFVGARPAHAALSGSAHDFSPLGPYSKTLGINGSCSACHRPHNVLDSLLLWTRELDAERTYFNQDSSKNPNYVPDTTLLCYDCHDDNATTATAAVDNEPPKGITTWASSHEPQDVAFGYSYNPASPYTLVNDDAPGDGGTKPGYYELIDGEVPGGSTALPAAGDPTGGHYWQQDPPGTPDYNQGDKIACSLCHDPHNTRTGTPQANEAFFLASTRFPNGSTYSLGTGLDASDKDDTTNTNRSRNGTGTGREMCAACHAYSNLGTPVSFGAPDSVPRPPSRLTQHRSANTTPCTVCHAHNQIYASCEWCHGFPPMRTYEQAGNNYFQRDSVYKDVENYKGGAGAHQRHKDALGDAIFQCEICHGPNAGSSSWHNQGGGTFPGTNSGQNVDIMGESAYWDPTGARSNARYTGTASSEALQSLYEFKAKGGGNQRCANFACHGDPPDNADDLTWTGDMVKGDTPYDHTTPPVTADSRICKWCHDATPSTIDFGSGLITAPNVMGDGTTWGADVNGHGKPSGNYEKNAVDESPQLGKAAANKDCVKCHDATYNGTTPRETHFDSAQDSANKRLQGTINSQPVATRDAVCVACHQNAGADAGTQASNHGNQTLNPSMPTVFARQCRQCHEPHGRNWNNDTAAPSPSPRNLHMIGKWVDANNDGTAQAGEEARVDSNATTSSASITAGDAPVVLKARSGANSWDDGFDDGLHNSVCVVCHTSADMNPLHGGTPIYNSVESTAVRGTGHLTVGTDCSVCHYSPNGHDPDTTVATNDAFEPAGCFGCHGWKIASKGAIPSPNTTGIIDGQYWPSGKGITPGSLYTWSDDKIGAHFSHVDAISRQIFNEPATEVVKDTTAAQPGLSSYDKQKVICAFCHKDPGGGGHLANDNTGRSPTDRVDMYQGGSATNYFKKYTTGAGTYGYTNFTDDVTALDATFVPGNRNCTNLVCHNQAATPVAGWPAAAADTDTTPDWSGAGSRCSTTTCHATATYTIAHTRHVGAATKNYECLECHANNNAPTAPVTALGHGNGKVDMVWNNAGSKEAAKGGSNGFYDKEIGGVASSGDTGFAYKNGVYNVTCNRIYCHGGDNTATYTPDWGGGTVTPIWNSSTTTYCGSCHDGNGTGGAAPGGTDVIASGNHTVHLTAAKGPLFADTNPALRTPAGSTATSCLGTATIGCHTDSLVTTAAHVDGSIEFANIAAVPAFSPLGTLPVATATATDTDRCSHCHSTASVTVHDALGVVVGPTSGTALVKTMANWDSSTYELPCLTCHNGTDAGSNYPDGTGRAASNMLGTNIIGEYGAEIRGHGLTAGTYPIGNPTPNAAANKYCTACHDKTVAHVNNTNDAAYAPGNRMLTTIMGVASLASASAACKACHANAASTATKKNVNTHSNTDYPAATATTQGRQEQVFAGPECMQCHEPHGMTFNNAGYNIYMVAPTITVVPGASPVTVPDIRFEALTGDNSFNDTLSTPNNDLCVVCHINGSNPGAPMVNVNGDGVHNTAFYDGDERGHNCAGCHPHNRDNVLATADGFMPVACNSCHTYPGLANLGGVTHRNSQAHDLHAGDPVAGTVNNYAFRCRTCHYSNNHNETGMNVGGAWAPPSANVDIRFDPARNGGSPTYDAANASTASAPGVGGTGVCAALYCHGDGTNGTNGGNVAFPTDFQGNKIAPAWSLTALARTCVTCHESAATFTAPLGTNAHPKHVNGTAAGGYAIGCQVCHYGTTTDGAIVPSTSMTIHVNGSVEVSFNQAADTRVTTASAYDGDTVIGSGYGSCSFTYCHSRGTDTDPTGGFPDDAVASPALAWSGTGTCWSCHGNPAAAASVDKSMPDYVAGSPKANKHDIHNNINKFGCQVCHYQTTQDGSTIANTAAHVNASYTVGPNASGAALYQFAWSSPNCNAAVCHGGNGTITWSSGPYTCNVCHGMVNGAVTDADVDDFGWAGATPTMSKIGNSEYTADAGGHGDTTGANAPSLACADCHDSSQGHDTTAALTGTNPFRLVDQGGGAGVQFSCSDASCHASGVIGPRTGIDISTFTSHTSAAMSSGGYTTIRTWPAWTVQGSGTGLECANCHDPHGDGNRSMINRRVYDKGPFILPAPAPAQPTEQLALSFTDDATGLAANSYANNTAGDFSGICQECHEDASVVSFHDGQPGGTVAGANHPSTGGNPGDCSNCHMHDKGFAPMACDGCHSNPPYQGINGGSGDDAPVVMNFWTGSASGNATYGGHGAKTFDPDGGGSLGTRAVECSDCHNVSSPSPSTHLNGYFETYSYPGSSGLRAPNTNTAHLVSAYFGTVGTEKDWQLNFDNNCYKNIYCHKDPPARGHRHEITHKDGVVRFGNHSTVADPKQDRSPITYWTPWTIQDISTDAPPGTYHYGPCVACHDPHGADYSGYTDCPDTPDGNHHMLKKNNCDTNYFCNSNCHRR